MHLAGLNDQVGQNLGFLSYLIDFAQMNGHHNKQVPNLAPEMVFEYSSHVFFKIIRQCISIDMTILICFPFFGGVGSVVLAPHLLGPVYLQTLFLDVPALLHIITSGFAAIGGEPLNKSLVSHIASV